MKQRTVCTSLLLSLMILVVFIGCGSPVPISDADDAFFDDQLVGRWQTVSNATDETVEMLVLPFSDREYYVEMRDVKPMFCAMEDEVLRLRAYITDMDGHRFLNAQTLQDERAFYFYAYALQNGGLTIQELTDVEEQQINKFESSEALYTFVRQNVDSPALYGEVTRFARMPLAN